MKIYKTCLFLIFLLIFYSLPISSTDINLKDYEGFYNVNKGDFNIYEFFNQTSFELKNDSYIYINISQNLIEKLTVLDKNISVFDNEQIFIEISTIIPKLGTLISPLFNQTLLNFSLDDSIIIPSFKSEQEMISYLQGMFSYLNNSNFYIVGNFQYSFKNNIIKISFDEYYTNANIGASMLCFAKDFSYNMKSG